MSPRRSLVAVLGVLPLTLSLAAVSGPAAAAVVPTTPAANKSHWLAFGWPLDHPKSLSFPGGGLSPGGGSTTIQYYLTSGSNTYYPDENVSDLHSAVNWSLASGYLPSPISSWPAGAAQVTVQHFANSVRGGAATAVYTRVTVANHGTSSLSRILDITAPPATEIPLTGAPSGSDETSMYYALSVPAGRSVSKDFVALAAGTATGKQLAAQGTFDANYRAMAAYWNGRLGKVALPTALPDPQLVDMYKAALINNWELMHLDPDGTWEQRTSGGTQAPGIWSYDAINNNDEMDIVQQYIRAGDYATAKKILSAAPFQAIPDTWTDNGYLDAALKFAEPFALYQHLANDPGFFTPAVQTLVKNAMHKVSNYIVTTPGDPHLGLVRVSNDFDNARDGSQGDYLINDDFAAIAGLQAYQDLAKAFGSSWAGEASWAAETATGINTALNNYLQSQTFPRVGGRHYYACLDQCAFATSYTGNYLGTTWLMSSLPWDGALAGNTLGGTWSDAFDDTNYAAFDARDTQAPGLPAHSWGAWWSDYGYGNSFNAGSGVQLLAASDVNLRTEAMSDLEWLLANQSAPMQWGESFSKGSWSTPLADNNAYGLASTQKAILETSVSVAADGTAVIGRGLPTSWIASGKPTSWTGVPVGGGATIGFTMTPLAGNKVRLTLTGDRHTPVRFELPLFVGNVTAATSGTVDSAHGIVTLPAGTASTTVTVRTEAAPPLVVASSTAASINVGQSGDFQSVGQSFFADSSPTVQDVRLDLRRAGGNDQSDATVSLYAVSGGVPTGGALATATIPASSIGTSFTEVTAPLTYDGLVDGRHYAIVVSQQNPSSSSSYQWATTAGGGPLDIASSNGTAWTARTGSSGNAWLALDVRNSLNSTDLSTTGTAGYTFGQPADQVSRGQLFLDTAITSLDDVRIKVARYGGSGQTDLTVGLYATGNGTPSGHALASATVPSGQIGTSATIVKVPLTYHGLVPGKTYAVVLGQQTPDNDSNYLWTTSGSNGLYGFGKFQPDGSWKDESNLGDAWLQISGTLN